MYINSLYEKSFHSNHNDRRIYKLICVALGYNLISILHDDQVSQY